jgi:hypothetical protein
MKISKVSQELTLSGDIEREIEEAIKETLSALISTIMLHGKLAQKKEGGNPLKSVIESIEGIPVINIKIYLEHDGKWAYRFRAQSDIEFSL